MWMHYVKTELHIFYTFKIVHRSSIHSMKSKIFNNFVSYLWFSWFWSGFDWFAMFCSNVSWTFQCTCSGYTSTYFFLRKKIILRKLRKKTDVCTSSLRKSIEAKKRRSRDFGTKRNVLKMGGVTTSTSPNYHETLKPNTSFHFRFSALTCPLRSLSKHFPQHPHIAHSNLYLFLYLFAPEESDCAETGIMKLFTVLLCSTYSTTAQFIIDWNSGTRCGFNL